MELSERETSRGLLVSGLVTIACWTIIGAALWMMAGCNFVGHMTNNFPPGRNEAGMFWRSTTDIGAYSDTGEGGQEQSSAMIGGSAGKPGDPLALPTEPIPLPTKTDKDPPSSPGATPK
jgi:hypothetical protein